MKKIVLLFVVLFCGHNIMVAQKINAQVSINAQRTGKTQLSIFKTLQKSVEDFINKTNWTKGRLPKKQRINCNFFITINSYSDNNFKGTLQIQSSRPVYGSAMSTPVFNFKDAKFDFSYTEYQPLAFNLNNYESNLVSTISFYVYVILGMDADTFAPHGGEAYFAKANQIAGIAEQRGGGGWAASSSSNSRYALNRQLSASGYRNYHKALYLYHRKGLDVMHKDLETGKENIAEAIKLLAKLNKSRPNTALIRSFFDAKAREITAIFSGGPSIDDIQEIVDDLNDMAPTYNRLWSSLP